MNFINACRLLVFIFVLSCFSSLTAVDSYQVNVTQQNVIQHSVHRIFSSHFTPQQYQYNLKFCPATSLVDFASDGFFTYPLDVFYPFALKKLTTSSILHPYRDEILYACLSLYFDIIGGIFTPNHHHHICAPLLHPFLRCPVIPENIHDTLDFTSKYVSTHLHSTFSIEQQPPMLYHVWKTLLHPKKTLRIFLLGGSATEGAGSEGCVCDARYDMKCFAYNSTIFEFDKPSGGFIDCRWMAFLLRYLHTVGHASIEVYYLVVGGTHSTFASINLPKIVQGLRLHSHDLVLIDYSMNEALSYFHFNEGYTLEYGMESLIRTIFEYLVFPTTENVHKNLPVELRLWPTVIFLATWPFDSRRGMDPNAPFTSPDQVYTVIDYQKSYRKLTEYYHIPLWSIRDAIWSNSSKTRQALFHGDLINNDHPLWYQHQFYADIIASIMQREFLYCAQYQQYLSTIPSSNNEKKMIQEDELLEYWYHKQSLPPPLVSKQQVLALCDPMRLPLLDLSAEDEPLPQISYTANSEEIKGKKGGRMIGSYLSIPADGWKIVEERRGKMGWISEFHEADYENNVVKPVHTLYFFLDDLHSVDYFHSDVAMQLLISYLATYQNAGVVEIMVCGLVPGMIRNLFLDALWTNYDVKKFSNTEIFAGGIETNWIQQ